MTKKCLWRWQEKILGSFWKASVQHWHPSTQLFCLLELSKPLQQHCWLAQWCVSPMVVCVLHTGCVLTWLILTMSLQYTFYHQHTQSTALTTN
jgi:hypothetical protein